MKRLKKTGKKCVAWSIVAVMAATGRVSQLVIRKDKKHKDKAVATAGKEETDYE